LKTLAAQTGVIRAEAGGAEGEYRVELEKDRELRADLSRIVVGRGWISWSCAAGNSAWKRSLSNWLPRRLLKGMRNPKRRETIHERLPGRF